MSTAVAVSIRTLVSERLRLCEQADPRNAVAGLVDELDEDTLREVAADAIGNLAVDAARNQRNRTLARSENGSGKWDRVAEAVAAYPGVFGVRVYVGDSRHKFLADCTAADLVYAEGEERRQGEAMVRRADQYSALGKKLRKGQTVADLGETKVEAVFHA